MMEIKNNKEELPLQYYTEKFAGIDPVQRAKELTIPYENECFSLSMLGQFYRVHWPDGAFFFDDASALAMHSNQAKIFLLRYILTGKPLPSTGKYLAFRELPWGEVYIQPFTGRCLTRSAWKYQSNPDGFCTAAKTLGGIPVDHADAGFRFDLIGDYHLIFYLWSGDEEFPPSAQVEFSNNFAAGFTAEDSVVAAEMIISAISVKMKKQ